MGSEGELKKRVWKMAQASGDIDTSNPYMLGMTWDAMKELIDEAKQDIMPIVNEWFAVLKKYYENTYDWECICEEYKIITEWFGDSS